MRKTVEKIIGSIPKNLTELENRNNIREKSREFTNNLYETFGNTITIKLNYNYIYASGSVGSQFCPGGNGGAVGFPKGPGSSLSYTSTFVPKGQLS